MDHFSIIIDTSLIKQLTTLERKQAQLAAKALHGVSLAAYLKRCLRQLRNQARAEHPDLFGALAMEEIPPLDRTIYRHLTEEGRRSVEDLVVELGLSRGKIRAALERLQRAGLIDVLDQGGRIEETRGARRRIYVSLGEKGERRHFDWSN